MDGSRFDTLSRVVTATRSRRQLARLLGGLVLSGPLALLEVDETTAKRKKGKKRKKRPAAPPAQPPSAVACTPNCPANSCGANGCGGTCSCGTGLSCCAGACVDLANDTDNCGSCGRSCAGGCVHGVCACPGPDPGLCPPCSPSCRGRFEDDTSPVCGEETTKRCHSDGECDLGSACLATGANFGVCSQVCPPSP